MINLKHEDGDDLLPEFVEQWFQRRLDRLKAYWTLDDRERATTEARLLLTALETGRISSDETR